MYSLDVKISLCVQFDRNIMFSNTAQQEGGGGGAERERRLWHEFKKRHNYVPTNTSTMAQKTTFYKCTDCSVYI